MQRLGQHFLVNRSAIKKIVRAIAPMPGETIIEIGPGHGEFTHALAHDTWLLANGDSKLVAIERDTKLAEGLRKEFAENKNIEIIEGDALKLLPRMVSDYPLQTTHYKLIGNIPYYITGHLLRTIGELQKNRPSRCVFMIQKEVAERITAEPPEMNRLAASVQYWAKPKILFSLSEHDFDPPPRVRSAVILLENSGERTAESEMYYRAVRTLFQQPRKTILNNFLGGNATPKKEKASEELEKIGINPLARPQDLTVEQIILISELFPLLK